MTAFRYSFALVVFLTLAPLSIAAKDDQVEVYTEQGEDNSVDFFAINRTIAPVTIKIELPVKTNIELSIDLPAYFVLEPQTEDQYLFSFATPRDRSWRYSYRYSHIIGDQTIEPDLDYPYLFPFAHGTKHNVGQGFNGGFSHFGQNQYAVDFDMDEGTPVHAARAGLVVEIKEDSNRGGSGRQFINDGNFVRVLHEDSTLATYVHLQLNGAAVEVGDYVEAGELVGYSGSTGLATGPHLHFDIRRADENFQLTSIPMVFLNYDGEIVSPQPNTIYYSSHPGKPPFEIELAQLLDPNDFADFEAPAQAVDTIEFVTEQVDNSYIVYVENGYDRDITGTVSFTLTGMESSNGTRINVSIPAQKRIFVSIVSVVSGARSPRYSVRIDNAAFR